MLMQFCCSLAQSALFGVLLWGQISGAQTSQVPPRIIGPVDELSLTTLQGNVPAVARPQYDRGEAEGTVQLNQVRIVLARSANQQQALDRFEQELQEKSSPHYHHWLTPDQFGRLYGPSDSDIAAIVAWLQSHGLTLESVSPGRTNIAFSGRVSQLEEALHTSVHSYERNGERFYSNATNPQIPSALAPVIRGIADLNTFRPKPLHVHARSGRLNPATGRLEPSASAQAGANFALTGNLFLVPGDAATIYDTPNSTFNANYSSATKYDGTGVTIGIGGGDLISAKTIQNYRSNFLGDTTAPTITNVDGISGTLTAVEPYLDVEIAAALAPGAKIHYYAAQNLDTAIERSLTDNAVDIFSFSYGECEKGNTTSGNALINSYWEQAAAQGIVVTVGSGDSGSAGCDPFEASDGSETPQAMDGFAVNGFASSPYDIAVGGTDFDQLDQNFSGYVAANGTAKTFYRRALKYIPETTWNDSTQYNNDLAHNQPLGAVGLSPDPPNIIAGGGGPSNCSTTNATTGTCVSGYSKPVWQRGAGVPADGVRDLPDVAMMAGNGFYGATWLVCDATADCTVQSDGSFSFEGYGGTSAAAPAFAGILALVEQSSGGRLGQAAKQIYDLYNGSHAPAIFHDITQGNNSVSCTQGSPNCAKDTAGYFFESGYNAAAGYDMAAGLGSVDAAQLVSYWSTATSGFTATITVAPASSSITVAQSLSVTVTVAGSAGLAAPSGTVTLTGGGYTSSAGTLSNGTYIFTIPAGSLAAGTDALTVTYSGDTNYASATGTATVVVASVAVPAFTLSATSPPAIAPGAAGTSMVTVTSSGGYTGAVTLSCVLASSPAGATELPTCSVAGSAVSLSSTVTTGTASVSVNTTAPAAGDLQAAPFGGSRWFKTAGGSALLALVIFFMPGCTRKWKHMLAACMLIATIGLAAVGCGSSSPTTSGSTGSSGGGGTPSKATPTVTVSPAKSTITLNTPVSVAVTITGAGTIFPSGTVTLGSGSYASSATALTSGAANITIPASTLPAGQDALTASYTGDANYNAATGNATLTVTTPPSVGGTTPGSYTFSVTGTGNDSAKTSATTTFTVTVS
ncbi:MAG: protease pro-enzyme activation domain-containing protein [Candidatus Sulfotelmatobacter sp.]